MPTDPSRPPRDESLLAQCSALALAILGSPAQAEQVMADVLAAGPDPADAHAAAVRLLNLTHRRSVELLREEPCRPLGKDLPEATAELDSLPLAERELVALVYFGGLTVRQAATRLGLSVEAARQRLVTAMRDLRLLRGGEA